MKWILCFLLISFQLTAHAQDPVEKVEEAATEVKQKVSGTSFYRANSRGTALIGFEAISTWVPLKFTGSYTHIFNEKWSMDLEAAHGSFGAGALGFSVASISETRFSLLARRYTGNSFHWIFGAYQDNLRAKLGSQMLDRMSRTSIDEVKVDVLGATLGIGNRWQWQKGFTLGIDWFRMNLPVFNRHVDDGALKYMSNNSDHDAVKRGIERASRVPTFVLLGIYLGYTF